MKKGSVIWDLLDDKSRRSRDHREISSGTSDQHSHRSHGAEDALSVRLSQLHGELVRLELGGVGGLEILESGRIPWHRDRAVTGSDFCMKVSTTNNARV